MYSYTVLSMTKLNRTPALMAFVVVKSRKHKSPPLPFCTRKADCLIDVCNVGYVEFFLLEVQLLLTMTRGIRSSKTPSASYVSKASDSENLLIRKLTATDAGKKLFIRTTGHVQMAGHMTSCPCSISRVLCFYAHARVCCATKYNSRPRHTVVF